jgi:hypothetical protein
MESLGRQFLTTDNPQKIEMKQKLKFETKKQKRLLAF